MNEALPARLSLPAIFGIALATGFSGAVVPGSLLAVVVRESLRVGWKAGPLLMVGHGALELVAVVLLVTGLIRYARSPLVRGLIGVVGGAVLIYLAYMTFGMSGETAAKALRGGAAQVGQPARPGPARPGPARPGAPSLPFLHSTLRLAILGAVMSMSNPYWWLWWATIGAAHVGWATRRGRAGGATYFVGHVLSDILWYCAVAAALAAGATLLSAGTLRGIYVGCAVFLLGLGVIFVVTGVRTLRATHSRHH